MDGELDREAQARLERDYLSGSISADEYTRLRLQLHEGSAAAAAAEAVAELRYASWGKRAAALLLDWLILIAVIAAVSIWTFTTTDPVTDEPGGVQAVVFSLALFVLPSVYQWLTVGRWGQTLGKMALGVKVVRGEDAGRIGYARAAGRVASAWVLGFFVLPLVLAYLWPLWDKRNQTLYDKMVNTIVLRTG